MALEENRLGQMVLGYRLHDQYQPERELWLCVLISAIEEALGGGVRAFPKRQAMEEEITIVAQRWLAGRVKVSGVDIFQVLEWLDLDYNALIVPIFAAIEGGTGQKILDRLNPRGKGQRMRDLNKLLREKGSAGN